MPVQLELNFDNDPDKIAKSSAAIKPSGYKGLSKFHKYWGKKPVEYWKFLICQLTEANDIVMDPFLGSGLIAREAADLNRRFLGIDINPISIELTNLFLEPPKWEEYKKAVEWLKDKVKSNIEATYASGGAVASHYLWEVEKLKKVWIKNGRKKLELDPTDSDLDLLRVFTRYSSKFLNELTFFQNSRINTTESLCLNDLFTGRALHNIDLLLGAINQSSEKLRRSLYLTLTSAIGQMSKMVFAISGRGKTNGGIKNRIEVGSWVIGYWRPALHFEVNVWNCFENKANALLRGLKSIENSKKKPIRIGSTEDLVCNNVDISLLNNDVNTALNRIPSGSIKLVLTDPPHGDRIPYLELSTLWNSILNLKVDFENEIIISNAKERNKTVERYNRDMNMFFKECERVLTDLGCVALMFNARKSEHWEGLKILNSDSPGLKYIGCFPMNYSAGSVVQDNRKGGLKHDYVLIYSKAKSGQTRGCINDKFVNINGWRNDYPNQE